jgi:uncharacterized membrane protein YtjA (UPF0391 family)
MLRYAAVFLLIAIIAGVFGFSSLAGTAAWFAKLLFVVFLVAFIISSLIGRKPKL